MGRIVSNLRVTKVLVDENGTVETDTRADSVTAEEPLEIRVGGSTVTSTMRTPGYDIELVHGYLYNEGFITSAEQVKEARYCAGATGADGYNTYNVLEFDLLQEVHVAGVRTSEVEAPASDTVGVDTLGVDTIKLATAGSACGISGIRSVANATSQAMHPIIPVELDPQMVTSLPDALHKHRKNFKRTRGVHAAAAITLDGEPVVIREDIDRHNAADKVVGHLLMEDLLPASEMLLVLSSRATFESVQKAVMAGFSGLIAYSAPTTLAVQLARETGLALTGFTRPGGFNLYSGSLKE